MLLVFILLFTSFTLSPAALAERIEVYPSTLALSSARARSQLVVTGYSPGGEVRDLSREATFTSSHPKVVDVREGVAVPLKDGKAELTVAVGGHSTKVPVEVSGQTNPEPVRFRTEVLAVLTRQGCNSGSCHGSPQGKGGFALSLFGYDPRVDEENLVRGGLNRRVDAFTPAESLLLKKPLMRLAHVGGKRLNRNDLAYRLLHDWIAGGAKTDDENSPPCVELRIYPGPNRVLRAPHLAQQLSVVAKFADGTLRDVTPIATYETSHKEVLEVSGTGLVSGLKRGQGAISIRYLNHLESVHFTMIEDVPGFRWSDPPEANFVDHHVDVKLKQLQVVPSDLCDDATFLRRVYLDLTGLLPPPGRARRFLADTTAERRAKVIDELLASEEFARYWALRTADLMRVTGRTLPEGRAEGLANWLIEGYRKNTPFDRVTTELLTATGNAATVPAVGYFLAIPTPEDLAETTAQLFMGSRINCAKCHNHPFENWTQEDYYRIAAVFNRVQKVGAVVKVADSGEITHPATGKVLTPFGGADGDPKIDRRIAFARWLTAPGNRHFARVEVNRIWHRLFGRGIVHPVDDFRSSNPPTIPDLLDALATDFERSGYDRKHVIKLICNSRTYQRSTATNPFNASDDSLFSHYLIRRMSAEQVLDGIGHVTGALRPVGDLAAEIADVEKSLVAKPGDRSLQATLRRLRDRTEYATQRLMPERSAFLRAFGQPKRESPCACERTDEPTVDQALQLLNGPEVASRLAHATTRFAKIDDEAFTEAIYLAAFARHPTAGERDRVRAHLKKATDRGEAIRDVLWAVINTREFLLQH